MIEIIGTELYQWDTGRHVKITGIEAEYAHFANKGDSKAVIMDVVAAEAKIPDYLLQTGKPLCVYAVKDGITIESYTFSVRKRERPENYVYEDDQRNYIYELTTNAEMAIAAANHAAEAASPAADNANAASVNANNAAVSANEAAKNANEAAAKAAHTAKSLMVVGTEEGTGISLDDAIEQYLVGLRIFGKTTQAGIPTPDAPVELVSIGNGGSITVNVTGENDAQSMIIATPNGLPGIPVTSGGNYTDANGQQWICDEIDFDRGVYVQRTYKHTITGSDKETYVVSPVQNVSGATRFDISTDAPPTRHQICLCNAYTGTMFANAKAECCWCNDDLATPTLQFRIATSHVTTAVDMKARMQANPVDVVYILATPIETPLSEEELASYAALHTYKDHTTVYNDGNAYMELQYVMDAKKYIDRMIQPPAVRIVKINLLASAWVGSGNLYSQVVSIDGVTKNTQVNLTPSVQQLSIFYEKDITFSTENDGGVITVYVIGQKPEHDYTIQASIVEVIA